VSEARARGRQVVIGWQGFRGSGFWEERDCRGAAMPVCPHLYMKAMSWVGASTAQHHITCCAGEGEAGMQGRSVEGNADAWGAGSAERPLPAPKIGTAPPQPPHLHRPICTAPSALRPTCQPPPPPHSRPTAPSQPPLTHLHRDQAHHGGQRAALQDRFRCVAEARHPVDDEREAEAADEQERQRCRHLGGGG
jgi:hypothetical protein